MGCSFWVLYKMRANLEHRGISSVFVVGQRLKLSLSLTIESLCLIEPVLRLSVKHVEGHKNVLESDTHQGGLFFPWLPTGEYVFHFELSVDMAPGSYELGVGWGTVKEVRGADLIVPFVVEANSTTAPACTLVGSWCLDQDSQVKISALSWQKGLDNWFHRHFCHATTVIGETFLAGSDTLSGRILDIGAGEGITDLGIVLRYHPSELVAMDIVDYLQELPRIAQQNDLPLMSIPENLTFLQQSCEQIPYPDNDFDLVISWGSVEHVVGGYKKVLDEVWRVLKPGGYFFVNPGLFYASYGSHLGEFSDEPHLHLKKSEQKLKELVLAGRPNIMDRAGFDVSNTDYWRFYQELNRIKVAEFEKDIKAYGYTVVRAALRANDLVEYSPDLQQYSILDLAIEDVFFTLQKPLNSGYE